MSASGCPWEFWLPWPSSGFHTVGAALHSVLFLGVNGALGTEVFPPVGQLSCDLSSAHGQQE